MALLTRETTRNLLTAWHDDRAFADAIRGEIEAGRLKPKQGEKLIVGRFEPMTHDRTHRKIRLGRM